MEMKRNVVIIGGGPSGLSAAIYTGRAGLQPLVLAGSPPGGQLMLTTEVENYPGYTDIMGPELVESFRKQALHFGTEILDQNVISVDFSKQPFVINTSDKQIQASSVIISTGAKALWLGLDSEPKFRGRGLSACATCDGFFFKNKVVAVVGGGDTAMEEAHTLSKFANKVYLIHRRDKFRASKIMQDRIYANSKIEVVLHNEIIEIIGDQKVQGIKTKNDIDGKKELALDGVFVAIGHKPDTDLFKDHINLDEKGYIITADSHALSLLFHASKGEAVNIFEQAQKYNFHFPTSTSIPGVFASGDCVDHLYRQAGTAAGMGIAAGLDAERWLMEND